MPTVTVVLTGAVVMTGGGTRVRQTGLDRGLPWKRDSAYIHNRRGVSGDIYTRDVQWTDNILLTNSIRRYVLHLVNYILQLLLCDWLVWSSYI